MPCSLTTIKSSACSSGIAKEQSAIKLLQLIAQLTCEASQATPAATHKIYRALLTQSGANAPTVVVLENTLGATPTWTRTQDGVYKAALAGAFPVAKTFLNANVGATSNGGGGIFNSIYAVCTIGDIANSAAGDGDSFFVSTLDSSASFYIDGILENTPIEVLVYP